MAAVEQSSRTSEGERGRSKWGNTQGPVCRFWSPIQKSHFGAHHLVYWLFLANRGPSGPLHMHSLEIGYVYSIILFKVCVKNCSFALLLQEACRSGTGSTRTGSLMFLHQCQLTSLTGSSTQFASTEKEKTSTFRWVVILGELGYQFGEDLNVRKQNRQEQWSRQDSTCLYKEWAGRMSSANIFSQI